MTPTDVLIAAIVAGPFVAAGLIAVFAGKQERAVEAASYERDEEGELL